MTIQTAFMLLLVFNVVVAVGLTIYAYRRRQVNGAFPFALMMVSEAVWTFSYLFEINASELATKLFWNNFKYIAPDFINATFLVFALQYSGRGARFRHAWWLLTIVPAITAVLLWVLPVPDMVRVGVNINTNAAFPILSYTYGPWAWVEILYNVVLELAGLGILISHFIQSPRIYRVQIATMITGSLIPLVSGLMMSLNHLFAPTVPVLDMTIVAFVIANPVWGSGLFFFHLLDLTPIARQHVVNSIKEMMIVLDNRQRIVDINPSAQDIFSTQIDDIIGLPFAQVLPHWAHLVTSQPGPKAEQVEVYLGDGDARRYFNLRRSPIYDWRGVVTGLVFLLHDSTERKLDEMKMEHLLSLLGAVIESTSNGTLVIDHHLSIVTVNHKFLELWGLPDDWATLPLAEERFRMMTEQVKEPKFFRKRSRELLQDLEAESSDIIELKNGRIIERHITPYRVGDELVGQVYSCLDVTERKRMEVERGITQARLDAVFNNPLVGIDIIDLEGHYLQFNQRWPEMLGYMPEEFSRQIIDITGYPDDNRITQEKRQALIHGEINSYQIDKRFIRKDGSVFWGTVYNTLIRNEAGKAQAIISMIVDIDERKKVEETLQNNERKYRSLAEELARSNADLQQFAYVASHDLQEPLRKIVAFGERLRLKYAHVLDVQGTDYLERMESAARRMQAMIDALLDLSRVATHRHPFELTDLNQIARDVQSDLELRIEKTGGKVEIGDLPVLEADPAQMRQLFANLIGNALKYYEVEHPPVVKVYQKEITLATDQPDFQDAAGVVTSPCFQLFFEDNGIGFDERYLNDIFQPFRRLHSRTEYEGTGIGLAICRKIVERHGGLITARSKPGHGATFIITLPVKQMSKKG